MSPQQSAQASSEFVAPSGAFVSLFEGRKPLIGVFHMYDSPENTVDAIAQLEQIGFDGVVLTNHNPATWSLLCLMQTAELAMRRDFSRIRIGLNVIRQGIADSFRCARGHNPDFLYLDVGAGEVARDWTVTDAEFEMFRMGFANPVIGGLRPGYYQPISPLEADVAQGLHRLDGLVLTGEKPGLLPNSGELLAITNRVRQAIVQKPVIAGSGVTVDNVSVVAPYVDGIIVGKGILQGYSFGHDVDFEAAQQIRRLANLSWGYE